MDYGIKTYRVSAQETIVRDVEYTVQATSIAEAINLAQEGIFDDSYIMDECVEGMPRFYYVREAR